MEIAYFVPIHLQTWPLQAILISDWSISKNLDRDEMGNLYRRSSIDASYQVSVHLAKQFQRRILKKIGQSETRIACRSHVC
jgi:hypothetical protein